MHHAGEAGGGIEGLARRRVGDVASGGDVLLCVSGWAKKGGLGEKGGQRSGGKNRMIPSR